GVNWRVARRCSGVLLFGHDKSQLPVEDVLFPGETGDVFNEYADFSGRCAITGHIAATYGAGWRRTRYTATVSSLNNVRQQHVRAGLEYAVANFHTLGAQATWTRRDFYNRTIINAPGL